MIEYVDMTCLGDNVKREMVAKVDVAEVERPAPHWWADRGYYRADFGGYVAPAVESGED